MTGAESSALPRRRSATTAAAFVIGLPLAAGVLYAIFHGPFQSEQAQRYVSHGVEQVEVVLFCCALATLVAKAWKSLSERAACRADVLPAWDGTPVAPGTARTLLAGLEGLPRRLRNTYLVNRVAGVLDFLCRRDAADDLDDHLRTLTDNDALAMEGSYALTRFITWAIPILGFLGTVLGITQSIQGVTPEVLEKNLSQVTDGLALAFDATALGLFLTMITMFLSFLVERSEQGTLDAVDAYVDRHLAHRFERGGAEGGEFVTVVRQHTQVLVKAMEQLVQRQTDLWAKTFEQGDKRRAEAEERMHIRLSSAVEAALEKTLEAHGRRLAALEKQVVEHGREQEAALARLTQGLTARTEALTRLQEDEKQLLRLQDVLNQNLANLAGAGNFEGAVHSLTAAVHLLTARAAAVEVRPVLRKGPGAAA